jgi:hypothetical protein
LNVDAGKILSVQSLDQAEFNNISLNINRLFKMNSTWQRICRFFFGSDLRGMYQLVADSITILGSFALGFTSQGFCPGTKAIFTIGGNNEKQIFYPHTHNGLQRIGFRRVCDGIQDTFTKQ